MTQTTLTPQPHAEQIKAWADGAQIEFRGASDTDGAWRSCRRPTWREPTRYRVKPREPREFYMNTYPGGFNTCALHESREAADAAASANRIECLKVREVIE